MKIPFVPLGLDFAVEEHRRGLKGQYKSESSLMTCEAELHGSVTRMVYSILSVIGSHWCDLAENDIIFGGKGQIINSNMLSSAWSHLCDWVIWIYEVNILAFLFTACPLMLELQSRYGILDLPLPPKADKAVDWTLSPSANLQFLSFPN